MKILRIRMKILGIACSLAWCIFIIIPSNLFWKLNDPAGNYLLALVYGAGLDWCMSNDNKEDERDDPF